MGLGSPIHWLIVLAIVILIFGTGKLKNLGKDLGASIKGFKKAMNEEEESPSQQETKQLPDDKKDQSN